jgi:hypothetical protein
MVHHLPIALKPFPYWNGKMDPRMLCSLPEADFYLLIPFPSPPLRLHLFRYLVFFYAENGAIGCVREWT